MPKAKIAAKHNPFASKGKVGFVTGVVGAENTGAGTIAIAFTFANENGHTLTEKAAVYVYFSSDAAGLVLATAPSSGIAVVTNGLFVETLANQAGLLICSAAGLADLTLTEASTGSWYANFVLPDGSITTIGPATFV